MTKNIFALLILMLFISCKSNKSIVESHSKYFTDSIYSKSLSEYRKHNIYLPKNFNSSESYPIVYATDGFTIKENSFLKKNLDSLIENNIIRPIIFVESHCNTKIADSSGTFGNGKKIYNKYRYFEYVEKQTNDSILSKRFDNHMHYFKNEMITHIEKQLNQQSSKTNRYFYGFSNGADFGISLLNYQTNIIGTYLCFSAVGMNSAKKWTTDKKHPNLYIVYGTKEGDWVKNENEFMRKVYNDLSSFISIKTFDGGHDYRMWNNELIKLLTKLFSTNK